MARGQEVLVALQHSSTNAPPLLVSSVQSSICAHLFHD